MNNIVWQEYISKLNGFILNRVKNKDDAEDILQDTLTKAIGKIGTLKNCDKLNSWLFQIARNTIIDHYRKKSKYKLDEINDDLIGELTEDNELKKFSSCIIPFINTLSSNYKDIIYMNEIENLSYKEISEKLNISMSALKSRVIRGRKLLKESFQNCCKVETNSYGTIVEIESKSNCGNC